MPNLTTGPIGCLYSAPRVSSNGTCQSARTTAFNSEQMASSQRILSILQPSCNKKKLITSTSNCAARDKHHAHTHDGGVNGGEQAGNTISKHVECDRSNVTEQAGITQTSSHT